MPRLLDSRDIRASNWVFPTKSNVKIAIDISIKFYVCHAMMANNLATKCATRSECLFFTYFIVSVFAVLLH